MVMLRWRHVYWIQSLDTGVKRVWIWIFFPPIVLDHVTLDKGPWARVLPHVNLTSLPISCVYTCWDTPARYVVTTNKLWHLIGLAQQKTVSCSHKHRVDCGWGGRGPGSLLLVILPSHLNTWPLLSLQQRKRNLGDATWAPAALASMCTFIIFWALSIV